MPKQLSHYLHYCGDQYPELDRLLNAIGEIVDGWAAVTQDSMNSLEDDVRQLYSKNPAWQPSSVKLKQEVKRFWSDRKIPKHVRFEVIEANSSLEFLDEEVKPWLNNWLATYCKWFDNDSKFARKKNRRTAKAARDAAK